MKNDLDNLIKFDEILNPNSVDCYKKCKGKVPINKKLYSLKDVLKYKGAIGWVVQPGWIVVDVDNKKDTNIMKRVVKKQKLKCIILNTMKGAHFIFKEPKTKIGQVVKAVCALGIEFDTRSAGKGYIIIPYQQENRKWVRVNRKLEILPRYLFPQKHKRFIKAVGIMREIKAGNRNDTIYRYYLQLIDFTKGINLVDAQLAIKLVNSCILNKNALSDKELHTVVLDREDIRERKGILDDNEIMDGLDENDPEVIAEQIIREHNIITKNEQSYIFKDGYYKHISDSSLQYMIHHKYAPKMKQFSRKEVIQFIYVKTDIVDKEINSEPYVINCENARVDIWNNEALDHDENVYDTIRIPHTYNPGAKPSPTLQKFLDFIFYEDAKREDLIYEMIGSCLLKTIFKDKMFLLVGEKGGNGKSTLLEIIQILLGESNYSSSELSKLAESETAVAGLYGKLANIGDDLQVGVLKNNAIIKTLISGRRLEGRFLYKASFSFKSVATLIFATNKIPGSYDKTDGWYRRFYPIDFNRQVPLKKRDRRLLEKFVEEDFEYLLYKSIKAIRKALKRNYYTDLRTSGKIMAKHIQNNSSVAAFCADYGIDEDSLHKKSVKEMYLKYRAYCELESGIRPISRNIFNGQIESTYIVKTRKTTYQGRDNVLRWVRAKK